MSLPERRFLPFSLLAVLCLAVAACGDKEEEPVLPPRITELSPLTVQAGDTLVVSGQEFSLPASTNRVVFRGGVSSVPFAASESRLQVVVPSGGLTGEVTVRSAGGASNGLNLGILHEVGEVAGLSLTSDTTSVVLLTPEGGEGYLVVPHSTAQDSTNFPISIQGDAGGPSPGSRRSHSENGFSVAEAFHRLLRAREGDLAGRGIRLPPQEPAGARAVEAPPDTQQFFVLNTIENVVLTPSHFDRVTAALVFEDEDGLVYMDIETPEGAFNPGDLDALGSEWVSNTYPTVVSSFGGEPDVDGNGAVIILLTPAVNRLTPPNAGSFIAGFFLPRDLFPVPVVQAGTTNHAEILYSLVPDPDGEFNNAFTRDQVWETIRAVFAHEFQHLINFNQKVLTFGTSGEKLWLNEGLSHMAEDLAGFDKDNVSRSKLYLARPNETGLFGEVTGTLEERGASFLFLRYLGDVYGEGIFRKMVVGPRTHKSNVQNAVGVDFNRLYRDWLVTLYLSGRGITEDPAYNYVSLGSDFGLDNLSLTSRLFSSPGFSETVRGSAGTHVVFTGASADSVTLRLVNGDLQSGMRAAFVRIQ
jgi:hypothetical protein